MSKKDKVIVSDVGYVQAYDSEGRPIELPGEEFTDEEYPGIYANVTWLVREDDRGWFVTDETSGGVVEVVKVLPEAWTGSRGQTAHYPDQVKPHVPITIENKAYFSTREEAESARERLIGKMGGTPGE